MTSRDFKQQTLWIHLSLSLSLPRRSNVTYVRRKKERKKRKKTKEKGVEEEEEEEIEPLGRAAIGYISFGLECLFGSALN